jgi:hypothetical protein
MMGARHAGQQVVSAANIRDRPGLANQEMLLQNEYLAAENRILRAYVPARLRLSDPERSTLAEIGKRLGRKALGQVVCVAKPDTIPGVVPTTNRTQV